MLIISAALTDNKWSHSHAVPRFSAIFSSTVRSPGRAIVLPPALAAVSALAKC